MVVHSPCVSGLFYEESYVLKTRVLELEFESDRRVLPTCVISTLEPKRLLHKGYEAYLAHVIDTSTLKVTLESVSIVREFSDVFFKDLPRLLLDK